MATQSRITIFWHGRKQAIAYDMAISCDMEWTLKEGKVDVTNADHSIPLTLHHVTFRNATTNPTMTV